MRIKIKPLSVNDCWCGRRFKTKDYKHYEVCLSLLLPKKMVIPDGLLEVEYTFGLSSKSGDIDNIVKPLTDILQKKYDFNDKRIYRMILRKVDVKKGEEFIEFDFRNLC
jgi:Holliday junction resolvase RusA-like endonuclease